MRGSVRWIVILCLTTAPLATPRVLHSQEDPRADQAGERTSRQSRGVRSRIRDLVAGEDAEQGALEYESGEKTARLKKGWIPVLKILAFLEEATGRLVIYPSVTGDPAFGADAQIRFLGDQERFDARTAQLYLESNGYTISGEHPEGGPAVFHVGNLMSRTAMPLFVPEARYVVGPGDPLPEVSPETRVLLVIQLEKTDPSTISQAMRDLFNLQAPGTNQFKLVSIPRLMQLIVIAPISELRTVRALITHLDRESPPPIPEER
jgi:hypothetical protein